MPTLNTPILSRWRSHFPLQRGIKLLIGTVCLSLIVLELLQIVQTRSTTLQAAVRETQNLARSLALHADGVIGTADAILIATLKRVQTEGDSPDSMARLSAMMQASVASDHRIHNISLFDETGRWVAMSAPATRTNVNYADRGYFIYLRQHNIDVPYIGPPVHSRFDNSWVITVSRRVNHSDGSFAGILNVTLSADLFQDFYDQFDVGKNGTIVLFNDDGPLLVRHPFLESNIGRDLNGGQLFMLSRNLPGGSSFDIWSSIDNQRRMGSFDKAPRYHLTVAVSLHKDDVLAIWRNRTKIELILLFIVVSIFMALGYHLATQIAERCETEARYRLLADNASDAIICVNSKGHRSYVSPSFCGMTGWTQEELVGMSRHDLIAPEDHMAVNTGLDRLSPGDPPFTEQYRQVTRSGKPMWVEMRASAVTTEFEGVLEYILNIRDITQQKLAEDELAEANAELSAISLNDSLTGIANRRNFDQTLRREWNRAKRGGHSLALLMVDADQFKAYNDRYGHVMGDDCLKVIAKRLAGSVQRAGDFVARYGGEEFAVILPDMLVENASIVAERMRKAFLEETRLHDGNEPGIVTVSIGVTAIVPGRAMEETVLLELADKALYQAKHEGRNRVVALKPIREVPRVASAEASQDPLPIVLAMPA